MSTFHSFLLEKRKYFPHWSPGKEIKWSPCDQYKHVHWKKRSQGQKTFYKVQFEGSEECMWLLKKEIDEIDARNGCVARREVEGEMNPVSEEGVGSEEEKEENM